MIIVCYQLQSMHAMQVVTNGVYKCGAQGSDKHGQR